MENTNTDWQTAAYRQTVVDKINGELQSAGITQRNATEMENHIFQKSRSEEDYMNFVSKIVMHVQSAKNKKQQQEAMPDPINALQTLASQGTRNPMPSQIMGIGGSIGTSNPNVNASMLQNLIHQRPGQQQQQQQQQQQHQQMQSMQNMQAVRANQQGMPNNMQPGNMPPGNMPSGNMPPGAINANMNMGGVMGQQPPNAAGQMPNNVVGQINQMQMREMNVPGGGQINPINNMMSMNINPSLTPQNQMNASNLNQQLNPNQQQMNPNQVSQLLGRINSATAMNQSGQGAVGNQINQAQIINQMNAAANASAANMPTSQPQINAAIMPNANMPANINQPNVVAPNQMSGTGQMNLNPMINMPHMGRNQPPNVLYQVRNTTPNQPYFRKSPSPSAPSPMAASLPNQMVPSPALVPSPQVTNIMSQRNVMAPSPSSTNLNTPGQTGAAPSPLNPQEEHLYREKYRQLTKYIEPLKRMVARIPNDDEKLLKMNKLLEILCNPNQRIPLETLLKCEVALEKMDLKSHLMGSTSTVSTFSGGSKEHHMNIALLDAVGANLQSPIGNHTLQRTFRPCLEALFGPDIKNLPSAKQPRLSTCNDNNNRSSNVAGEIPHILQGEIARLDHKFKISFDPSAHTGSKIIKLICSLDDKYLPCVPPVCVFIPEDYPASSPSCNLIEHEYNATPFLSAVQKSLTARVLKLPIQFSLSHLLDTWEMAIRQACSPSNNQSATTNANVLLGI